MRTALKLLIALYFAASSVSAAEMAMQMPIDSFSLCGSPIATARILKNLPIELAMLRQNIEALDTTQGTALSGKDEALRKQGRWSDAQEDAFFRRLVSSATYQDFERQRTDLVNAYMQATESFIESLSFKQNDNACRTSSILISIVKAMHNLTEQQWNYMLSEKEKALIEVQR